MGISKDLKLYDIKLLCHMALSMRCMGVSEQEKAMTEYAWDMNYITKEFLHEHSFHHTGV